MTATYLWSSCSCDARRIKTSSHWQQAKGLGEKLKTWLLKEECLQPKKTLGPDHTVVGWGLVLDARKTCDLKHVAWVLSHLSSWEDNSSRSFITFHIMILWYIIISFSAYIPAWCSPYIEERCHMSDIISSKTIRIKNIDELELFASQNPDIDLVHIVSCTFNSSHWMRARVTPYSYSYIMKIETVDRFELCYELGSYIELG